MVKFIQEQLNAVSGNISIDEAALVSQAMVGNMAAIEKLILKYQDRIYNTVLKLCGNEADAAELAQDSFVKAIQSLKDFRAESSFYTWLFRIAVNHTLNFCKKNNRLNFESLQNEIDEETEKQLKDYLVDNKSVEPSELASKKEVNSLIIKALEKLEPQQRAVIVLRDIEQMSYNDIAHTLNMEIGTVKSRIARGRKNIREIIEAAIS
jgi:RNA polymerase sigma-70 factor (ECF subfamily)